MSRLEAIYKKKFFLSSFSLSVTRDREGVITHIYNPPRKFPPKLRIFQSPGILSFFFFEKKNILRKGFDNNGT